MSCVDVQETGTPLYPVGEAWIALLILYWMEINNEYRVWPTGDCLMEIIVFVLQVLMFFQHLNLSCELSLIIIILGYITAINQMLQISNFGSSIGKTCV